MAAPSQTETKTIEAVILSAEARRFWEQVYLAMLSNSDYGGVDDITQLSDVVLAAWRERFEPKAGELSNRIRPLFTETEANLVTRKALRLFAYTQQLVSPRESEIAFYLDQVLSPVPPAESRVTADAIQAGEKGE